MGRRGRQAQTSKGAPPTAPADRQLPRGARLIPLLFVIPVVAAIIVALNRGEEVFAVIFAVALVASVVLLVRLFRTR